MMANQSTANFPVMVSVYVGCITEFSVFSSFTANAIANYQWMLRYGSVATQKYALE